MAAHYKFKNRPKIQLKSENKSYSKGRLKVMSFASSSLSSMRKFSLSPNSFWNLILFALVIDQSMLGLIII